MAFKMEPVNSSNLNRIGYDNGNLVVEFKTGSLYEYSHVPAKVYADLLDASKSGQSVGSLFFRNVRNKYSYQKLSSLAELT